MLFRKIEKYIETHLRSGASKILVVDGARQVGKTYIIRYVGKKLFENYIEVNLLEDSNNKKLFEKINTVSDFYIQLSALYGQQMKEKDNTLIFLDEIQVYPNLITLLKFLKEDDRFTYIASGSLLGVTLSNTSSVPIGSIHMVQMYPLDFEEFLYANGVGGNVVEEMREAFYSINTVNEGLHRVIMDYFKKYLLVGGFPDVVNSFISENNIYKIRMLHKDINSLYASDCSKYDIQNKLKIIRIYQMIPSFLENRKKRVVVKDVEQIKGKRFANYQDEFEYLISSGIALENRAIANPTFPLISSSRKNLLKLYMNDVGLLTSILFRNNIRPIMEDISSINLGTVYENLAACELKAHGHNLYYYDNKNNGEVDFILDDFNVLSVVPVEIKSGKDYSVHSALSHFIENRAFNTKKAYVFSNDRNMVKKGSIIYSPIYNIMFVKSE